jgi:hypothetical protein
MSGSRAYGLIVRARSDGGCSRCWSTGAPGGGAGCGNGGLPDINFLAGIIKRRCPTAPYLSDTRREPLVASTERRRWKALPMASVI